MRRREFLGSCAAAITSLGVAPRAFAAGDQNARQFLELRVYQFASALKQRAFGQFLSDAGVPAFNRAGIQSVGVFQLLATDNAAMKLQEDPTDLWVLLPHDSIESVVSLYSRLADDRELEKAGAAILNAPKSDPAYQRYQSTLLLAMEGFPRIRPPQKAADRVFELRTYESHTDKRARNKLQMFNAGEFAIFDRAGMPGVFFGGAIIADNLPQLTYMIVHEKHEDSAKNWAAFFKDPQWKQLSGNAAYKDNVSKVIDSFLRPSAASQV